MRKLAALAVVPVAVALIAAPAQAASERPACPVPSKVETKSVQGVRVDHLPKGFTHGEATASRHDGVTEYGYRWSDDRDSVNREHRSLWVRVVCWPKARGLGQLRRLPVDMGTFTYAKKGTVGGRQVLWKEGDGALGHGRYVGWVERRGVVVTVMASRPLVPELSRIVKGIKL